MTKLKETIHFENEEGICKTCVELGRQSAQKEELEFLEKTFPFGTCYKEIAKRKQKLKSATTKEKETK